MRNIVRDYGLSLVLVILFIISWAGQGYFQWWEFVNNQNEHHQPVKVQEFIPEFASATLENWQSEFLQLLTFVVLTSFLIHKGSAESRDGEDEIKARLTRIESMLEKRE